jgi:hypothetical protein
VRLLPLADDSSGGSNHGSLVSSFEAAALTVHADFALAAQDFTRGAAIPLSIDPAGDPVTDTDGAGGANTNWGMAFF